MTLERGQRRTRIGRRDRDFVRKSPTRDPSKRILVLCEGQKSEPYYFNGFKKYNRLTSMEVLIDNERDPIRICEKAILVSKRASDQYDVVYCVFDCDDQDRVRGAIELTQSRLGRRYNIKPIVSSPCFEYWIMCHFSYSSRPYENCEAILENLNKECALYQKNCEDIFILLKDKLPDAIHNAKKVEKYIAEVGAASPYSSVYKIFDFLGIPDE